MNDHHLIINIGRQIGSGGREIAQILAERLGCDFYDRRILNIAARESGFDESVFEQIDEKKGLLRSLFHLHTPFVGDDNFYTNNMSQESLFKFQSDAIRNAAKSHNCVFVGRCADYILRDYPNAVSVFITADKQQRINRVAQRRECSNEEAERFINESERERARFYNYYTGKIWGHSQSYDLCISSSALGIEGSCDLIQRYIEMKRQTK